MEAGLMVWLAKYAGIIALVVLLGERLARLTPNTTDDMVVNWLRKVLKIVGVDLPNIEKSVDGTVATSTPVESDK